MPKSFRLNLTPGTRLRPRLRRGLKTAGAGLALAVALWMTLEYNPSVPAGDPIPIRATAFPVSPAAQQADQGVGAQLLGIRDRIGALERQKRRTPSQQMELRYLRRQSALLTQLQDLELRLALRGDSPGFDRAGYEARRQALQAQLTHASD